jgi:hypothetical protein
MIIWLSLLIPLIGAFIMLRWFRSYMAWWEVAIPLVACIIFTLIFKFTVEKIQTTDTEYWSSLVQKAEFYEPYTTWVHKTCSRTIKVGKSTTTVYYDCSYCDENGPEWIVENQIGERFNVSQQFYQELLRRWKANPEFVELNRDIEYHSDCGYDGDMYQITWDGDQHTAEQTVSDHWYENRVQAAHTAFDFPEVSDEDVKAYKLYGYPEINGFSQDVMLGADSIPWLDKNEKAWGDRLMQYCSGHWGTKVHGKVWLLFFKDLPQESALMQEAYWDGGNDNDVVICMGLSSSSREIQWTKVFSWSPNRKIIVDLREDIMNLKTLNFNRLQDVINARMPEFERKDFKEFSYITVDPPTWAIIVTFIITFLLTVGLCYWAIVNQYVTDETDLAKRIDNRVMGGKDRIIEFFNSISIWIRDTWFSIINRIKSLFKNGQ